MRRKKALKRGRVVPILVAAGVGYLIGTWNAALLGKDPTGNQTAAAMVALRFPQALSGAPAVQAASYERAGATNAAAMMEHARLALFDPQPMFRAPAAVPPAPVQAAAAPNTASEPPPEVTADLSPVPPAPRVPEAAAPIMPKPDELTSAERPHPAPPHHQAKRPGYMLSDAQIADIKRRLHLTPDQEQMWPAVAAALRNIGAESEREAAWRGAPSTIDPDSPQVQDLKSAAIPLLMSFSDEQKDEVRNLAHRMGLDQLASEF